MVSFEQIWTYSASGRRASSRLGDPGVMVFFPAPGHVDGARDPGLLQGPGGPVPGVDVVGAPARPPQVHRQHGELQAGPSLEEEDDMVLGHLHQAPDPGLGGVHDGLEFLRAVGDLHDGHADASQVGQFRARLLDDFQRHRRRTCVEIMYAGHLSSPSGKPDCLPLYAGIRTPTRNSNDATTPPGKQTRNRFFVRRRRGAGRFGLDLGRGAGTIRPAAVGGRHTPAGACGRRWAGLQVRQVPFHPALYLS